MVEYVEILQDGFAISPGERWSPVVGKELTAFLGRVHQDARLKTRGETCEILARAVPPGERNVTAGLVVGYVQSGKTTSFTAAAALARDNGFALVIVIAGTSINLLEQTQSRLEADLDLRDRAAYRRWVHAKSPRPGTEVASRVEGALREWIDDDGVPEDRATVLISVMKQHRHLDWLVGTLRDIGTRVSLAGLSVLVIDDEADQASPNVKRRPGEESATYGQIRRLRAALPAHTLLEYTATPQATLLMSLVDELSPEFVAVIDPGNAYTGGKYFFQEHRGTFIKHIPRGDVQQVDQGSPDAPQSLLAAFATFALGCAAGQMLGGPSQRSMLVHPSQRTLPQALFVDWLKSARDLWAGLLRLEPGDPDRVDLVETLLDPAYEDLRTSCASLPPLDDLLARLPALLGKTSVVEVNATKGKAEPVDWAAGYAWVLVGGQLLDRGFTVEGLTVTYMPRSIGVGNADTVQQRARFFGYKRDYAGFCRAWLDPDVDRAFTNYVDHEEAMRAELVSVARSGDSLKNWRRRFLLDRTMRPTRASVVRLDTLRRTYGDKWFWQRDFDGFDAAAVADNRRLVERFLAKLSLRDDDGDARRLRETQVHPCADVPLGDVIESLLNDFVVFDEDSTDFAALRVLLAVARDKYSDEFCRVHSMMHHSAVSRRRSLDSDGRIKNLFQGANAATGYPGDRAVRLDDRVTVQVHRLELRSDDGTEAGDAGSLLIERTPVLAVWVPNRLDSSVILQR